MSTFADVKTFGIDIGQTTFHLIGEDSRGAIVLHVKLTRAQLMLRLSNAKPCVIGMEPCPLKPRKLAAALVHRAVLRSLQPNRPLAQQQGRDNRFGQSGLGFALNRSNSS